MATLLSAQRLADRFERRANRLARLGDEATRLHQKGQVSRGNVDSIYESALLNAFTAFELFLEDLFFSVLLGNSGILGAGGAVTFHDRSQAETVLLAGRQYLTWLPYDEGVQAQAQRLLINSPFTRLDRQAEKGTIKEIGIVRNAIAHDSASAKRKFEPLASGLPRRRTPAGWLQDVRQGETKHDFYSTQLRLIVKALAAPSIIVAKSMLSPEAPYKSGESPGKGLYLCVASQAKVRLTAKSGLLPDCPTCMAARSPSGACMWRRQY